MEWTATVVVTGEVRLKGKEACSFAGLRCYHAAFVYKRSRQFDVAVEAGNVKGASSDVILCVDNARTVIHQSQRNGQVTPTKAKKKRSQHFKNKSP